MFILMKTVIAKLEMYKERQGQTGTDRDRQGQARTSIDRQEQLGTSRDGKEMSLLVPVCRCLVHACPAFSLLVPALYLELTGIIGK